jgi:hypothetical protein
MFFYKHHCMRLEETGVHSHLRLADFAGWQGDGTINSTD